MRHQPSTVRTPTMPGAFSHLDTRGAARMVDASSKPVQARRALATGRLVCRAATIRLLRAQALPKGEHVLAVAQIAGIQAAKRTAELIPLCHPLALDHADISFRILANAVEIRCEVSTSAKTGVEMEALTGVSVAALMLYDMCKAVDPTMRLDGIRLLRKVKQ